MSRTLAEAELSKILDETHARSEAVEVAVEALGAHDSYGKKLRAWLEHLAAVDGIAPQAVPRLDARDGTAAVRAKRQTARDAASGLHSLLHESYKSLREAGARCAAPRRVPTMQGATGTRACAAPWRCGFCV